MLLTGCYRRTLDEKARLAIPKQLRDAIGFPQETNLFIAPGTDRALVIYTAVVLEQIGEALSRLSPAAKETRAFSRLFYAQAQPAEIDKQGRLRIPTELATWAGIQAEVVVVGVRDRIELWDASCWDQFMLQNQSSYDVLAEAVFAQASGAPSSGQNQIPSGTKITTSEELDRSGGNDAAEVEIKTDTTS